jgi:hypothetical protein
MRPTVVLVVVMATVNGLKAFVFQKVMTDGGPADSTEILTLLIQDGIQLFEHGPGQRLFHPPLCRHPGHQSRPDLVDR